MSVDTPEQQYWHFLQDDGRTAWNHLRPIPGRTMRIKREPILCKRGYHACLRAIDALRYAPGNLVQRCTLGGTVLHETGFFAKSVGQARTCFWIADASRALHEFAHNLTLITLEKWKGVDAYVDPDWLEAVRIKGLWLQGEATNAQLYAARTRAWSSLNLVAANNASEIPRMAAYGVSSFLLRDITGPEWYRLKDKLNADLESRLLALPRVGKNEYD